jgi:cytochrome c556
MNKFLYSGVALAMLFGVSVISASVMSVSAHEPGSFESPIVEQRVKRFKQSGGDIQAVFKKHLPAGNYMAIEAAAGRMAEWADDMPAAFPSGSPSIGANNDIWENFSDFEARAEAMASAARALQLAAGSGKKRQVAGAAKRLGGTCKSCHESYRIKH